VQVDPIKPKLKPPGNKRLKLKNDMLLSTSAFKSNLRRYILATVPMTSSECTTSLASAFAAGEGNAGFCTELVAFASRSCFCKGAPREAWFGRKSYEWVALAAGAYTRPLFQLNLSALYGTGCA